jgi:hypothetical protein
MLAAAEPDAILQLLMHTAGAITVTGVFVWYLTKRDKQQHESMAELVSRHERQNAASMEYLRSRDAQSKEIAASGHAALREVAEAVTEVSKEITAIRHSMRCADQQPEQSIKLRK